MKFTARTILTLLVFLCIAIALLYYAFRDVDFDVLVKGFKKANYFWVALAMLVGFSSHVVRALRWRLLIEPLGHKPSLKNTLGAISIGYLSNIIFPRIGEVTRCGSLRRTDKIPFESLLGTVIVERAIDIATIFLLLGVVFMIRFDFFGSFLWNDAIIPLWSKLISLIHNSPFYIIFGFSIFLGLLILVKKNLLGKSINRKLSGMFWGTLDGIKSVFTMRKRRVFIAYTALLWFLYLLMTWLLVFATKPTSTLGITDALFLLVVGSFGMAAPVQGGFGAFHVITAMALGIYGISWEDGLIFAIISHESQTLLFIFMGLIFSALMFWNRKRNLSQPI